MPGEYKKIAARVLAFALIGIYVYHKRAVFLQILTVFMIAFAFAILLAPIHRRLERAGVSSGTASLISILCLFLMFGVLISAFIPYLIAHTSQLVTRITPTLSSLLQQGNELLSRYGMGLQHEGKMAQTAASGLSAAMSFMARWGMEAASQTGRILFSLVIAYYLLREKKKVFNHFLLFFPYRWRNPFLNVLSGCRNAMMSYLSGTIKTSGFICLAMFSGLMILRVPDALLLSVFMGVFELFPYIGPILASIPILLITLPMGTHKAILALVLVVLVQQIESNIVSPYFMASSTSLHPFSALISVFVFGSLFGVWGVLLAIPAVVLLRSACWSLRQHDPLTSL